MYYWLHTFIDNLPWLLTLFLITLLILCLWLSSHKQRHKIIPQVWRFGWIPVLAGTGLVVYMEYSSYPGWAVFGGGIDLLNWPLVVLLWAVWLCTKKPA